ncbi:ABC transporter ATP-binding protein [Lewinellaceae bacterium SD302]|nr:ABC transporter ATP-binding protein [Lewinellaceae bacterium SD302]
MMIININKLSVSYGRGEKVLDQLDLRLDSGSITALAAPNGEGKTTLLKAICGLRFPDSGNVNVLGFEPGKRQARFLEQLYFLPAEPNLPAWTPKRIGTYYGPFYPNFSDELFQKCLADFSVDPDKMIGKLSFGQQRRVQLAFALAVRTELLLLDEPTLGLDIAGKDQFRRSLIQATEDGQTVIIATHQLTEVEPVLDNLLVLHEKKIHSQLNIGQAYEQLSFTLSRQEPKPFDGSYGRRVPGGWLVVKNDYSSGNAHPDLETLYLALTEGKLKLQEPQTTL